MVKDLFDVVSDDEQNGEINENEKGYSDLNIIVATKLIDDKAKEAGMHTVKPLLADDNVEE